MVDGALVLARKAGRSDHALLPAAGGLELGDCPVGLTAQDDVEQLKEIGVVIVERPACDLAFFYELRHGDLVKRLLGQQLQERVLDGGFGQVCQAGFHLSGGAARSSRGWILVLCGEILDVRIAPARRNGVAQEGIDALMQRPPGTARRRASSCC